MYWPHFFKFNSMRFMVMIFIFVLLPYAGFATEQIGTTKSIPPQPVYADRFIASLTPQATKGMAVIVGESLGGKVDHAGWIVVLCAILLAIKLAISYLVTASIFYYDQHRLSEEKKVDKFGFGK
jgi:hypothetical protein